MNFVHSISNEWLESPLLVCNVLQGRQGVCPERNTLKGYVKPVAYQKMQACS